MLYKRVIIRNTSMIALEASAFDSEVILFRILEFCNFDTILLWR